MILYDETELTFKFQVIQVVEKITIIPVMVVIGRDLVARGKASYIERITVEVVTPITTIDSF